MVHIFLAEHRKMRGLSQNSLSKMANISQSLISEIENNPSRMPTLKTMVKIAFVLNCSIDELLKSPNVSGFAEQEYYHGS